MDLGTQLRKYRVAHGYSQQFVADYLEISRNAYMAKEDNKVALSVNQMLRICNLYNVSISNFLNLGAEISN